MANAAKAGGKGVAYGTIGNGSLGHLAVTMLSRSAGLDLVHVPYKGGGPLMQDAIAGHVPLSIASVFVTKPHIDSGRMRPLAVTTSVTVAANRVSAAAKAPVVAPISGPRRASATSATISAGGRAVRMAITTGPVRPRMIQTTA